MKTKGKTLEKLEKLQKLYNQVGYGGEIVDRTLEKLIVHEIETAQKEAVELQKDLQIFEAQYQMSSENFCQRFRAGEMGDAVDFVEWSAFYEMWVSVRERLKILESEPN